MTMLDHTYNHSYYTDVEYMTYFITIMTTIIIAIMIITIRATITPAASTTVLDPPDEVSSEVEGVAISMKYMSLCEYKKCLYLLLMRT